MHWKLHRTKRTAISTTGKFTVYYANGKPALELFTLENPWLGNKRSVSCIPAGTYELEKRTNSSWNTKHKRKFGMNYIVGLKHVPDRSGIIVHEGNTAEDTRGCILLGKTTGANFIGNSRAAMKEFYKIVSDYGVPVTGLEITEKEGLNDA